MVDPVRIAVTGAAGNLAYALLFRLANGELFQNRPVILHLLEIEAMKDSLLGVEMELYDCAFPLLQKVIIGTDPRKVFEGVDYAFLVGAQPRGPGMERKDLLQKNGAIFKAQGSALSEVASKNVKALVVGNPCNTNALIAIHNAKNLSPTSFYAMTRLDENRAKGFLAKKASVPVKEIQDMIIWGNHSPTMVPDFIHARIGTKTMQEVIQDEEWLKETFIPKVQKRGGEIIKVRGKSSAASAASAALDAMKSIVTGQEELFSTGVYSQNNPYGIDEDLVFSFPCKGKEIIPGIDLNPFLEEKIKISEKELIEERDMVRDLL